MGHERTSCVTANYIRCYGHGCKNVATTALTAEEWREIQRLIDPPTVGAIEERKRLAVAVGRFETVVGAKLGTGEDRGGTFNAFGHRGYAFKRCSVSGGCLKWVKLRRCTASSRTSVPGQ
jgi:hypothetical protein